MRLLAANLDSSSWVIFLLVLSAVVFFHWISMRSHKSSIRMEVAKLRARLVDIRWMPFYGWGDKNDTFYEVTMVLPSGREVSAICKCNTWHGVYWKSTPWAQELMKEPVMAITADEHPQQIISDCKTCGYGIQKRWVVCPNCGTDVV